MFAEMEINRKISTTTGKKKVYGSMAFSFWLRCLVFSFSFKRSKGNSNEKGEKNCFKN